MARVQKTVFISYRRKDIAWALNVYRYLTNCGYDVFFDFTSIPSGDFSQIIISNIKARAHFLLILTPTALDRCNEPGDWLRREIETAISEKRNIIPLFFDGFSFGSPSVAEILTGQLATLRQYNGLDVYAGYFDAAMERLCKQYLNIALDAVLFPISAEVQQVVKNQQVAADQALKQSDQAEQKGDENVKPQKMDIEEDAKKATEKSQSKKIIEHRREPAVPVAREQLHKIDFQRWGIGGTIVLVLFIATFAIYYLVKNWPFGATPVSTVTLTPTYTLTPTKTPSPTATFTPTPGVGSTWTRPADGMVMVYVPEGSFIMGSNDGRADEKPVHTVFLDAFWIDQTEVTNKMYALCVATGRCDPPSPSASTTLPNYYGNSDYDDFPAVNVSWNSATAYCAWAGGSIFKVRLPTEAEWEKAASWDMDKQAKRTYPWGDFITCAFANYAGCVVYNKTTKVGSYPSGASFYGALDMAGNVYEWVADWYSDKYYANSPSSNPGGPPSGQYRGLRGGMSANSYDALRSAARGWADPTNTLSSFGFRCSRTP